MPIAPISNSLRLVDLHGNEISREKKGLFNAFENHLIDIYKEGNLIFIYRGESLKSLKKKLFSNHEDFSKSRLYERLFIVGDKARYFFRDKIEDSDKRGWLTNINDRSPETFGFMFERIANVISTPSLESRIQQSCSSRFLSYFRDNNNRDQFVRTVETYTKNNEQDRLKLQDYYLYFLHVAGSSGVRRETMLVSTSLSVDISEDFASKKDEDSLILYGFIPQPYHNFLVSPWLASDYHKIASDKGLPTYQPFGLFPEQLEVSVKGAFFPCFMMGVKQVDNEFVINSHIFNIKDKDYESVSKYGIPVQQEDFMNSILASQYRRFISSDLRGNFEQFEVQQ
ncbi:MAG: hypothetical protein VKJ02_04665 [Snowella sp.]|nr:hypothetical protein [Snowella sp.]